MLSQCTLELFLFMHICTIDKLSVIALRGAEDDWHSSCSRLRAEKAECMCPLDRELILGIIESAFGSCTVFDREVSNIFAKCSHGSTTVLDHVPRDGRGTTRGVGI